MFAASLVVLLTISCEKRNGQIEQTKMFATNFIEKVNVIATNELYDEIEQASFVMHEMQKQDLLPGVTNGEHGTISSDDYRLMESNELVKVEYPLTQTFRLLKNGETSTNNYAFERLSKNSRWVLRRAWKTDSNGVVIIEWPIKSN